MKALIFLLTFMISLGLNTSFAGPHIDSLNLSPEQIYDMKQEMMKMSFQWVDLKTQTSKRKLNYSLIREHLTSMKRSAKKIRRINKNTQLKPSVEELIGQLELLQRNAKKKHRKALKRNFKTISNTCFRCHVSHANP